MSGFPDFSSFCMNACVQMWGEPTRKTKKEWRWDSGDQYGYRTFNPSKGTWYDADQQRGGSTLQLVSYAKGEPACDLKGAAFFEAWKYAHEHQWVPDPPPAKPNGGGKPILAAYAYRDEQGELLFEVVRFDTSVREERFRQRRPNGVGGWTWKTKGTRQVLYRLPELIAAVKDGQRVLVCEGERDANMAVRLGFAATTNPNGVRKWKTDYDEFFRGADVVVVSDNDANGEGQAHAGSVARRLSKVAASVRTIMFPVKDLSQWVDAGGTREQLDALIEQAVPIETKDHADNTSSTTAKPENGGLQDAIALAFADQHAGKLRYVAIWNRWMQYNGIHWEAEQTLGAFDEARKLCREAEDADARTVASVVTLARSDRRLAATTEQWDADAWVLGTPRGTIDLRTGKLRPVAPADYITKITTVTPGGDCPLWLKFLGRVTGNDVQLQNFLQRMCGYALTGDTSEDALFFLYGTGANGKSVFIKTIAWILGEHHRAAPMEMFTVSSSDRHPTDLAMLRGARLVTAIETEQGKRWDEAKIKALTGGDRIPARFMRQDFFEFTPQFKLVIAGNHRPTIRTVDEAIRRRMNLVPFTVTIPKDDRDRKLPDKLKAEGPGILAWMVEGCLAWQRDGLQPPTAVTEATKSYLTSQDVLQSFIEDCCARGDQYDDSIAHLWVGWKAWAAESGEYIGTKQNLGDRLEDKGYPRAKKGGIRKHLGILCMRETLEASNAAKS